MMEDNKSAMGEPSTTQDNDITPTDSATEATQLPLWARPVEKKEKVSRRSKVLRNVLTRMEDSTTGPFSLLQRAVNEKLRVKVWTRSYHHIWGICTGFLVAYDKHWNLAMMDVDETYLNPHKKYREQTKKRNSRKHVQKKKEQESDPQDDTCSTMMVSPNEDRSGRLQVCASACVEKKWADHDAGKHRSKEYSHRHRSPIHDSTSKQPTEEFDLRNLLRTKHKQSSVYKDTRRKEDRESHSRQHSECVADHSKNRDFDYRKDSSSGLLDKKTIIKERSTYTSGVADVEHVNMFKTNSDFLKRHMGQVLLRGENVVMVSLVN